MDAVPVLDKYGFVRLDDFMASDLSVVNSARVSFGKRVDTMEDGDEKLILYLLKNRHGTPFEHNAFRFHVKAPIFVVREWQRHRIGSFNEMSARYMEMPADWYVPTYGNIRTRVGKPGHYSYEPLNPHDADNFVRALASQCAHSYDRYRKALDVGVAPEQARLFLHVNHYTEMYWTVNCRSLMNFLNLRNAPTAQQEIQMYAQVVEKLVRNVMPITMACFDAVHRMAP